MNNLLEHDKKKLVVYMLAIPLILTVLVGVVSSFINKDKSAIIANAE